MGLAERVLQEMEVLGACICFYLQAYLVGCICSACRVLQSFVAVLVQMARPNRRRPLPPGCAVRGALPNTHVGVAQVADS